MKKYRIYYLVLGWVLVFLTGCSSTVIHGVWKDPDYRGGKLDRVLVVGIATQELMRLRYEDTFVAHLRAREVKADPAYRALPGEAAKDQAALKGVLEKNDYRFLLISRLVDKRTIAIQHPGTTRIERFPSRHFYYGHYPYYRHWRDYYRSSYLIIETTPPHTSLNELIILETNLYDRDDEIIFSVQTETLVDFGSDAMIEDIVKAVIKALAAHELI